MDPRLIILIPRILNISSPTFQEINHKTCSFFQKNTQFIEWIKSGVQTSWEQLDPMAISSQNKALHTTQESKVTICLSGYRNLTASLGHSGHLYVLAKVHKISNWLWFLTSRLQVLDTNEGDQCLKRLSTCRRQKNTLE